MIFHPRTYSPPVLIAIIVDFKLSFRGRRIENIALVKDDVFSVSDTGILGLKEKSECSQQESNLSPFSD